MDRLIAPNTVSAGLADTAPLTGTPGYATDGIPGTRPATNWPSYQYNAFQEEMLAAIVAAGITPDRTNNAQHLQAMRTLFRQQRAPDIYATAGTYTYTVPAGVYEIWVTVVGAGGGGSGCTPSGSNYLSASGGGSGGWSRKRIAVTPGQTITVIVGAAGTPGSSSNGWGGVGGTSSFGAYLSATGGQPGTWTNATTSPGGQGGAGAGGDISGGGSWGGDGQATTQLLSGYGGASLFGGSPRAGISGGAVGAAPGAGGSGCYLTSGPGGAGAPGYVIVEY